VEDERMTDNGNSGLTDHTVVSHDEWLAARTAFLAKEKEFTRPEHIRLRRTERKAHADGAL
jgi:predicted dithiol-disulfide oxidoreductase (DUF899 family)